MNLGSRAFKCPRSRRLEALVVTLTRFLTLLLTIRKGLEPSPEPVPVGITGQNPAPVAGSLASGASHCCDNGQQKQTLRPDPAPEPPREAFRRPGLRRGPHPALAPLGLLQREARGAAGTHCSWPGTDGLRPSTAMLLFGLLTTCGRGGRTWNGHGGEPPRRRELEEPHGNILKFQISGPKINVEGSLRYGLQRLCLSRKHCHT